MSLNRVLIEIYDADQRAEKIADLLYSRYRKNVT